MQYVFHAVCVPTAEFAAAKILPEQQSVTEDFGGGEDVQELACAHNEV
jgi:hypothetical protein